MSLSFQNKIAFHYMIATAIIMAVIFGIIYVIIQGSVYNHLDNDLHYEAKKHTVEIKITQDSLHFINKAEWEEKEHNEIQVNPVFIQLIDSKGQLMDKSPNLKSNFLSFKKERSKYYFDAVFNKRAIRQVQLPVEKNGEIKGYILAAMSSETAKAVILKLRNVLVLCYLAALIGLYFISRFLAGRSIIPIKNITKTINRITKNNLNERVELPENKDEIYDLSSDFNELLQRIENTLEKEKQFTSDASHELRTPLATLRGTLEILIRKPRTQQEYEQKISVSLTEIDRMTTTIEQLLLLARLDNKNVETNNLNIVLATLVDETLSRYKKDISQKKVKISLNLQTKDQKMVQHYYSNLIMDNVISNAIKYTKEQTTISISIKELNGKLICIVKDQGIGIKKEDLPRVFNHFFRSDALLHKNITGNGLGLSIVKKSADVIGAKIEIDSILDKETTVTVTF